jgi:hypothetical protein
MAVTATTNTSGSRPTGPAPRSAAEEFFLAATSETTAPRPAKGRPATASSGGTRPAREVAPLPSLSIHFGRALLRVTEKVASKVASTTSLRGVLAAAGVLAISILLTAAMSPATLATVTNAVTSTAFNLIEIPIAMFLFLLTLDVILWIFLRRQ